MPSSYHLAFSAKLAAALAWRFSGNNGGSNDLERNLDPKVQGIEPPYLQSNMRSSRDRSTMEDPDGALSTVARYIEQLRQSNATAEEKENCLKQLLDLVDTSPDALSAVGSHSQAIPVLVSLLRGGSPRIKVQASNVLGSLSKDDELRIKVLLGGCIPPLLGLLKSSSSNGQIAAAETLFAVSKGGVKDHVGSKIFSTERVVPVLWEQLDNGIKSGSEVNNLLTGALRNLSHTLEDFWLATRESGGVDILIKLLANGQSDTLANTCFLLGCLMMEDASTCSSVLAVSATKQFLKLLGPSNEASVRAEAAGALKSLSAQCKEAWREIASSNGIPALINATIAPSKEFMKGEHAQLLQENAMCALANISGGLSYVISSLGESLQSCTSPTQIADTLGALASALMIYDRKAESARSSDPSVIEKFLIQQFNSKLPSLVEERAIEALASLYGNDILSKELTNSDAKRLLVCLITMAANDVHDELIRSLLLLCNSRGNLWHALQAREGVQLLISLLGLSSEQQQECAVALLSILSDENDESKWAITAAGGIPPLVQILQTGSTKAKEDSAMILRNLCNHSEDIRACIESADAVPALLWLLKNGSTNGKEIAAKTLNHLIHKPDNGTISQLSSLLTSDQPESKTYVLDALRSILSVTPLKIMLHEGSAANNATETIIKSLISSKEETRAKSASTLAELFHSRKDLRESYLAVKALDLVLKMLVAESEKIIVEALRCIAAIFLAIKQNKDIIVLGRDSLALLIMHANSSILEVAEQSTRALANLLLDSEISMQAFPQEIIVPVTRVLRDGTPDGRTHAAAAIARLLQHRCTNQILVDTVNSAGTVLSLVSLLESSSIETAATSEVLDALALLSRSEGNSGDTKPPWEILSERPHTIQPLVTCIANGTPVLQEKAIEVLSRLCGDQPVVLGDAITSISGCIPAISKRVISSSSMKIKVGGAALLVCAAKQQREIFFEELKDTTLCSNLIHALAMVIHSANSSSGCIEDVQIHWEFENRKQYVSREPHYSISVITGCTIPVWLLCLLACHSDDNTSRIVDSGAIEILTEKISQRIFQATQSNFLEDRTSWVCALLLALLFNNRSTIGETAAMRSIPVLVSLLRLEERASRYFAAQALCSLIGNGSSATLLSVANSGAAGALIPFLGCAESDIIDLLNIADEFLLGHNPELVALERLFNVDDIRLGSTSRKAIPSLVDLLKPIPDRPGAPYLSLRLLTQLAINSPGNKLLMVEAGALEALTRYLSLGPQEFIEEVTTHLLGILFDSPEIRKHETAYDAVNQLVAVLRLGGRNSRYSAVKALECLFSSDHIRSWESSKHAVKPLVEILTSGPEREQHASISALVKLLCENSSIKALVADIETNAVDVLCRIISSDCPMDLKADAVELCCVLFGNVRIRSTMSAARCVEPLVSLLGFADDTTQYSVVKALNNLLDDDQLAELVAAHGAVLPLVGLLGSTNYSLHEAVSRSLLKLGTDRPVCKIDMVKAGVIDSILSFLPEAPNFLCVAYADLLRILTNNASIAKGPDAAKIVEPMFSLLSKPELGNDGQHSALQILINILEHPQCRAQYHLTPCEAIEPVIALLDSQSQAVKQLAAELLSHLVLEEDLSKHAVAQQAIRPLIQVLGSGVEILQQRAIKALANIARNWPNEIAKEGGVYELCKVILQADPPLPASLWESAASALSTILQFSSEFYLEVPVAVLVQLLRSGTESTVVGALNALLVLESDNSTIAGAMVESGAIAALLDLLKNHQSEEAAARLLETLLNNTKIRETKAAKFAISRLSLYLLDPQTQSPQARLLTALALGNLFQKESLARCTDAASACRALVNLLEDQPTEEIKVVALCALQNLVMCSRSNKRAVAESGGIQVVLDLISSGDPDTAIQAAMFIKLLFSGHTIQEYASSETVRVITAAIEKDLFANGSVNEEYLKALNALLGNFSRLRATEPSTLCIPHLVASLRTGSEATQEAALETLYLLRQAWATCPAEVSKAQSVAASEAIPLVQYLIQSGPPRFQEKAELLLQCLPGTLTVTIRRGNNLKQSVGNPSVYCKLTLGNTPPRLTKVVSAGPTAEWNEEFAWAFDSPPKGQKLQISCKNKSKFGKSSFGKVTIQIESVVILGLVSGEYMLLPDSKTGPPRNLEIEFQWSNK